MCLPNTSKSKTDDLFHSLRSFKQYLCHIILVCAHEIYEPPGGGLWLQGEFGCIVHMRTNSSRAKRAPSRFFVISVCVDY